MKRSGLLRRSSLKRGGPLRRVAQLARSAMTRGRTALRRVGARALRERPFVEHFRRVVLEAAGGYCARCGAYRPGQLDPHHMRPRARGLPLEEKHDPKYGVALCSGLMGCHRLVTEHLVPDWARWFR